MAHPARLLVVDDDEMNRDMLSRRLLRKGYAVEVAEDGQQALALLASRHFDLVLLDNMMPGLSGVEVLQRIRQMPPIHDLSVIMVTAQNESHNVVAALQLGANDYITKPVDFAVAVARIESRLALSHASRELSRTGELYKLAARASEEGLWDWDLAAGRAYFSPRWKSMLGFAGEEVSPDPEEWFGRLHPDDEARVRAEVQSHIEGRTGSLECEYRMRHRDGRYRWLENRGGVSRDVSGRAIRMAGCQTDITERKTIDPLTALPNRLGLDAELAVVCEAPSTRGQVEAGTPGSGVAALLLLELDSFERIDESLPEGRAGGLIATMARRLVDVLTNRPDAQGAVAARPAHHQFAVLLRDVPAIETASLLGGGILAALNAPFSLDGETVFVTTSLGIALASPGSTGDQLLRDANAALRHARGHGSGRSEVFQHAMRERDLEALRLESDLRHAVERSEFVVYYQPSVDLETGEIEGFEALVRWRRPGAGLVMPGDFIPAAERTGLIVPIGMQVLERACRDTVELRRTYPHVGVNVNVSGVQFLEPGLVERVGALLSSTGLPAPALRLEITETVIMESPEKTRATLRRFREMTVGLKLDDFGTGYSSLAYLQQFPFDTLKIDRSFVSRLADGPESVAIVQAIMGLAHSLNLEVVAEGIETQEQLELLKTVGCRFGQGYWFSRPVELARLREMLADRRFCRPAAAAGCSAVNCEATRG